MSEMTSAEEMSQMLLTKLTRGMTPQQTLTITRECKVESFLNNGFYPQREKGMDETFQ